MTMYAIEQSSVSDVRVKTDAFFPTVLAIVFVMVYTQGYLLRSGVSPSVVKMAVELPVFAVMLHLVNRGVREPVPGVLLMAMYVIWTIISAIFNGDAMPLAFLYIRYVVYAYILFVAVWVTPMTRTAVMRTNAVIALLFVFQIVASTHEVFVLGERVEEHVGSLFADGGSLATEFPLLAMALTVSFYLFWRANPLLLLLAWAFLFVGYASGKRAVYFLGPLLYVCVLVWGVIRGRTLQVIKRSLGAVVIFIGVAPLLLLGISKSHGISHGGWEGPVEQVAYALDAAVRYTTGQGQAGWTTGRVATSRRVLTTLWSEHKEILLFGWGPSAARIGAEGRYDKLRITYGICGWAHDVICIGWPGMLIYVLFQLRMFLGLRSCALQRHSSYWAAVRLGAETVFFVLVMSYVCYSSSVVTAGHLSYVYFYLLALLMSPQHRHLTMPVSSAVGAM